VTAKGLIRAAIAFVAFAGCRSPDPGPAPAQESAPSAAAPVDHLAKGELLEGPAQAFDLKLPSQLRIDGAFADVVYVSGPVALHPLVQYLRARLLGGEIREGESSATIEHTQVARKPGRNLGIRIITAADGVRVELHDETPPSLPPLPDEKARWRRVGLTPDGRLADPQHTERVE
jgi:hypothetical protein